MVRAPSQSVAPGHRARRRARTVVVHRRCCVLGCTRRKKSAHTRCAPPAGRYSREAWGSFLQRREMRGWESLTVSQGVPLCARLDQCVGYVLILREEPSRPVSLCWPLRVRFAGPRAAARSRAGAPPRRIRAAAVTYPVDNETCQKDGRDVSTPGVARVLLMLVSFGQTLSRLRWHPVDAFAQLSLVRRSPRAGVQLQELLVDPLLDHPPLRHKRCRARRRVAKRRAPASASVVRAANECCRSSTTQPDPQAPPARPDPCC